MSKKVNNILYTVAEAVPFAKAGGVADVAGAFPSVLKKRGYDVRIIMPMHGVIDRDKYEMEKVVENIEVTVGRKLFRFDVYHCKSYEGVSVYLVNNHKLFGSRSRVYGYKDDNLRFYLFDRVVLKFILCLPDWRPEVIHCNDWQAGLIPYFVNYDDEFSALNNIATVYTIHNLSYQYNHVHEYYLRYGPDDGVGLLELLLADVRKANFAKRGILNADMLTAVSEQYAEEIQSEEFGMGLEDILLSRRKSLVGILNGIDYFKFDPKTDEYIVAKYDENELDKKSINKEWLQKKFKLKVDKNIPLFGIASRLVGHKGFDLVSRVVNVLLKMPVQIVVVGSGEKKYIRLFEKLSKKYKKKIGTHLEFSVEVASQIFAGSDMFLMPSKFEPCGLTQLIALRYGSVPIVHDVGGLADTITDFDIVSREGNGFVFSNYHELSFYGAIIRALEHYKNNEVWLPLVKKVMQERFSWEASADKYEEVYRKAVRSRKKMLS